jgi:hypothetical protein
MATRKQNSRPRKRRTTTAQGNLPAAADRQMIMKTEIGGGLENTNISQPPAVKKRNYVRKPAAAALETANQSVASTAGVPVEPVPIRTREERIVLNNGGALTGGNGFKKNRLSVLALALSGFLVLFVLFFCVIPLKQVNYLSPVVYQDVETYTDQEAYLDAIPYTEKEAYTVQQAYSANEPYYYNEPYIDYDHRPWPHHPSDNVTPPPPQPSIRYRTTVAYIPVTKYRTVTEYRDVQKVKYELKYRPIQKQRTVTKVRQEPRTKTVPMLYYLMTDARTIDYSRPGQG